MLVIECSPAFESQFDRAYLERLAAAVLKGEETNDPVEISLLITDDTGISVLNQEYRNLDASTDVLAFSMLPGAGDPFITPPGVAKQLGDVIISYEHAIAQAAEYGHPVQRELGELFVHGLLHILGYDHEKPDDAQIMAEKADEYTSVA